MRTVAAPVPVPDVARDAVAAIVTHQAKYWDAVRAFNAAAEQDTATHVEASTMIDRSDAIDAVAEALRRAHFPRAARLTVDQWGVYTWSPTGRTVRQVWTIDTPTNRPNETENHVNRSEGGI